MLALIKKLAAGLTILGSISAPISAQDCVVLLHGLARTEKSMSLMEKALNDEGFTVVNQPYKSRSDTVQELAQQAIPSAISQCPEESKINFVTHSMGGIVLRAWLHTNTLPQLHRVVMLGPPNQGSEIVDKLGEVPGFQLINGPAGMELGTNNENSLPKQLGQVNFSLGVIAGTQTINPILSSIIPGKDDGKVSVSNTRVDGMHDHISMAVTHTFMMRKQKVIKQTLYFLKNGHFQREGEHKN